jgi:hypothetical protein
MRKGMVLVLLAAVIVLSGCQYFKGKEAAVPQTFSNVSVVTAYSPSATFPRGSTYAFVKLADETDLSDEAAIVQQRIEKALTAELKKKGYKASQGTEVDFFVVYTVGLRQEVNVLLAKSKKEGNQWMAAVVAPQNYVNGALLVEVIDAKKMEPTWVGVFNADVGLIKVDEQAKGERVAYAVQNVLKTFPPK